jgi:hypothetical protein
MGNDEVRQSRFAREIALYSSIFFSLIYLSVSLIKRAISRNFVRGENRALFAGKGDSFLSLFCGLVL